MSEHNIFQPYLFFGGMAPKLWAPLQQAHQDASLGILESQIGPTVIEIMLSK